MDMDCREQILNEDYADLVVELPENYIHCIGLFSNPFCYGLMDIPSTEASGISELRNIPILNLRGRGVLIGIVDTGDRKSVV